MASFPGFEGYGGATITRVIDGAGAEWIGCTAKSLTTRVFGFYLFRDGIAVPYEPFCTARGTISRDGTWIAWNGNQHYSGPIPGFVPIPQSGKPGPPGPPGPAGAGAITLLPAPVTSPQWEGRVLSGGVLIDIPTVFGVPSASAYLVRFAAKAPAANVRARAGTEAAPWFLTLVTQAPDLEIHTQGWVHGPAVWVSAVGGTPTVWLEIEGHS